jgi:aquaporin PIP
MLELPPSTPVLTPCMLFPLCLQMTITTIVFMRIDNISEVNNGATGSTERLMIAFNFGLAIFVLVYLFADVSGANLNPAVSWGLCLGKRISLLRCGLYLVAQCLGATLGVGFAVSMSKAHFWETNGGANVVNTQVEPRQAFGGELICTWLLVTVVLCATSSKLQQTFKHQVRALALALQTHLEIASLQAILERCFETNVASRVLVNSSTDC